MAAAAVELADGGSRMILQVNDVVKQFGGLIAVNHVSFDLAEKQILGLIGPNGAGKTTLFNVISGVLPPTSGGVTFRGQDITGKPPYRLARMGIARTHQIVKPLNDLTVRRNVMVGACFGRENLRLAAASKVADEVLEFVRLAPRADQLAASLNVAQKKRLEMARALAQGPDLLLLDEVLAGLNPSEISEMVETIKEIRRRGVTIVMIEHVMHAVMNVSDSLIVLDYGNLIAAGTPEEITRNEAVIEAYLGDPKLAAQLAD
jgi:branched-chain amino acid transport system ATP-binding protein